MTALLPLSVTAAGGQPQLPTQVYTLPTDVPSGIARNDRIWITWHPAGEVGPAPRPAAILLHPLGEVKEGVMGSFARYLAARGIAAAVVTLPYHMKRAIRQAPIDRYMGPNLQQDVQALNQAASDVSTVLTWLLARPDVDPRRTAVIGVSLGAIVAHLAMGRDDRITACVAILGGGDLPALYRHSILFHILRMLHLYPNQGTPDDLGLLATVDPISYAGRNRPRHVLMIQAARDIIMPPAEAKALWAALGRPPILWFDANHYGLMFTPRQVMRASVAYLTGLWSGRDQPPMPAITPLTVKIGALFGLDSAIEPALQWQAAPLGWRPDHMALFHLDIGFTTRGPFVGLAATLHPYIDLGIARRFTGHTIRPYLSLHVVF